MKRLLVLPRAVVPVAVTVVLVAAVALVSQGSSNSSGRQIPGRWNVGDAVALYEDIEVTLLSADGLPPAIWMELGSGATRRADRLWLAFQVQNVGGEVVSIPSSPFGAVVLPGGIMRPVSMCAHVDGPGGGFGVGSDPYLEPGDSMYTLFECEVFEEWSVLEVRYCPLGDRCAIWVVK